MKKASDGGLLRAMSKAILSCGWRLTPAALAAEVTEDPATRTRVVALVRTLPPSVRREMAYDQTTGRHP